MPRGSQAFSTDHWLVPCTQRFLQNLRIVCWYYFILLYFFSGKHYSQIIGAGSCRCSFFWLIADHQAMFTLLLGGSGSLSKILFSLCTSHVTGLLPVNLISCKIPPGVSVYYLSLPKPFVFHVPTFFEILCHHQVQNDLLLSWNGKMSHFEHFIRFLYSIVNKIWDYAIFK